MAVVVDQNRCGGGKRNDSAAEVVDQRQATGGVQNGSAAEVVNWGQAADEHRKDLTAVV
jgi:hypothetical protein